MFKPEHTRLSPKSPSFSVITVSTSRYEKLKREERLEDESGDLAVEILESCGFEFKSRYLVPDDRDEIVKAVSTAIYQDGVDLVIVTGGTGISRSDVTIEAIIPLMEKRMENFDRAFFLLSYMQVGMDSVLSRATAGVIGRSAVFLLPGSKRAVELALRRIVCPEARHILHHIEE